MARLARTLTVTALALGTATAVAGPATAATAHHGHGSRDYSVALTRRAASRLDAANVDVKPTGTADSRTWGSVTVLSFPVLNSEDRGRVAHHGNDRVISLGGGVAFIGAQTENWTGLRINKRTHRVTALVDGDRVPVLRFRGGCGGGRDDFRDGRSNHHGRHGDVLRLTEAGAASLDRATGADTFDGGDAFAFAGR